MLVQMQIRSIAVPTDSQVVLVGVDLGVPGAHGEFAWSPTQARQFAYDLLGAADSADKAIATPGPKHYKLDAETGQLNMAGRFLGG